MDERGANIDLIFRNGLKDYEVLPPNEVWDSIHPSIVVKRRPVIFFRAAAIVAAVLALGFLAYQLSREIPSTLYKTDLAFNVEAVPPIFIHPANTFITPVPKADLVTIPLQIPSDSFIQENPDLASYEIASAPGIAELQRTNTISWNKGNTLNQPVLTRKAYVQNRSLDMTSGDPLYFPEKSIATKADRWSIGAMASPTYYSRFNSDKDALAKQMMASEQPLMSYSGGVALSYKINKRFSIQTGLYYASLGQQVDGINSFGGFQKYDYTKGDHNFEVLTASGSIYTNNPDVFLIADSKDDRILTAYTSEVFDPQKANLNYINNTIIQNFSYLELPVVLKYKFFDRAIDFSMVGGVSYDLLVNNKAYAKIDGGKYPVGTTKGLNTLTLSSSLGVGMEYSVSNKLSLNLEPTFRYYLNPFNEVTGSKNHPYSFGVFSGISYKF